MFSLKHIGKSFGDRQILSDINLSINNSEVVALIGKNGVGKTTLVNIACGFIRPDSGFVTGGTVGCVPQEITDNKMVADLFDDSIEEWQKTIALERVGLEGIDNHRYISTLSGGQRTRLSIAAALVDNEYPETLVFDEPTNNLDLEMMSWLRDFIKKFPGGVLMISHDRAFINEVATRTVELSENRLREYGGNYDFYRIQRDAELNTEERLYTDYISEKRKINNALVMHKSLASGSKKIKVTDNEKMCRDAKAESAQHKFAKTAKALESRLDQLAEVERPSLSKNYTMHINGDVHEGKIVLEITDLSIGYETSIVTKNINLQIRGPGRIQVTGSNGSGKTTLFRTIMGQTNPIEGDITIGGNIGIGYFSQDTDGLDYTKNSIENLSTIESNQADLRKWLHMLGISGHDVHKPVGDLSRGQRSKLGMARLLSSNHQLVILDEPTNHLDIATREAIESALDNYKGAILFASHDSYFAKKVKPDQVYQLD